MQYVITAYISEVTGNLCLQGAKGAYEEFPPSFTEEFFLGAPAELNCLEYKARYCVEHLCENAPTPVKIVRVQVWGDIAVLFTEQ